LSYFEIIWLQSTKLFINYIMKLYVYRNI
jgi:hypothetical protein